MIQIIFFVPVETHRKLNMQIKHYFTQILKKNPFFSPSIFIFFSTDFCATGVRHMPEVYMIRFFRKNLKIGDTHGKKDDCV